MKKKNIILIGVGVVVLAVSVAIYCVYIKEDNKDVTPSSIITPEVPIKNEIGLDYKLFKEVNSIEENKNYLISPLSIAYALSLLKEGTSGNTYTEIDKLLDNYNLSSFKNIPSKIGISNSIYIKNQYKNEISTDYINILKNNYNSDVLFDEFITPVVINNWVKEKTFGMINTLLDEMPKEFVLGVANALAIDVEWDSVFESKTLPITFHAIDGDKKVTFMRETNGSKYISNDNATGIVKDYVTYDTTTGERATNTSVETVSLEYIAIMPKGDLSSYVDNFTKEELNSLLANTKTSSPGLDINVSLPRYKYEYELDTFKDILEDLGMKDAFNPITADFSKSVNSESSLKLVVDRAIHKTIIELNENGTKAAAVTSFLSKNGSTMNPKNNIDITFDKPFMYIIREVDSDNFWFIGTVYEPELWIEQ